MVNVTIPLDRGLYRGIKREAREKGVSWQSLIVQTLEANHRSLTVKELDEEDAEFQRQAETVRKAANEAEASRAVVAGEEVRGA